MKRIALLFCCCLLYFLTPLLPNIAMPTQAETTNWQLTSNALPENITQHGSVLYQSGSKAFMYVIGGGTGSSPVTTVLYASINQSTGNLSTSWQTSAHPLPQVLYGLNAVIYTAGATPYIYVLGGRNLSTGITTVYYASINTTTGDINAWQTASNALPAGLLFATAALYQTGGTPYIYITGGQNNGFSDQDLTYYASINTTTGDVNAWQTSSQHLPNIIDSATSVIYQNGTTGYLYVMGGGTGSGLLNKIYYTSINATTGDIGTWQTASNNLPITAYALNSFLDATGTSPIIYIVGGKDNTNTILTTVYYASIDISTGSTGSWTQSVNSLPVEEFYGETLFDPAGGTNYAYEIGGMDHNFNTTASVYYSAISHISSGNIQIDYSNPIQSIDQNAFSIDESEYGNQQVLTNDATERQKISQLVTNKIMRIDLKYAVSGNSSSAIECGASGCDPSISGDSWISAIQQSGGQPEVLVPINVTDATNLVTHFNITNHDNIKYWVIGNEPDNNGISEATYASNFNTIYDAMKVIDPTIHIGGPTISYFNPGFMSSFLTDSGSRVDFIDYHEYNEGGSVLTAQQLFQSTQGYEANITAIRLLIETIVPSRSSQIGINVGEWSTTYSADAKVFTNFNTLYTASVLGHILRAGAISQYYDTKSSLLFDTANNTYQTQIDDPMPAYHGYGMFTGESLFPTFGSTMVSANTTLSNVEVYASNSPKNIVAINTDSVQSKSAVVNLGSFLNGNVEVWRKDQTMNQFASPQDIGNVPITNGTFSYTLSPYSVTTFVITPPVAQTPSPTPTVTPTSLPISVIDAIPLSTVPSSQNTLTGEVTSIGILPLKADTLTYFLSYGTPIFKGKGVPGAVITITIHSNPIVFTTTVDSSGNWSAQSPTIPDGLHTVLIQETSNSITNTLAHFSLGINYSLPVTGENILPLFALIGSISILSFLGLTFTCKRKKQY